MGGEDKEGQYGENKDGGEGYGANRANRARGHTVLLGMRYANCRAKVPEREEYIAGILGCKCLFWIKGWDGVK